MADMAVAGDIAAPVPFPITCFIDIARGIFASIIGK
jgi:hypothetical protein